MHIFVSLLKSNHISLFQFQFTFSEQRKNGGKAEAADEILMKGEHRKKGSEPRGVVVVVKLEFIGHYLTTI